MKLFQPSLELISTEHIPAVGDACPGFPHLHLQRVGGSQGRWLRPPEVEVPGCPLADIGQTGCSSQECPWGGFAARPGQSLQAMQLHLERSPPYCPAPLLSCSLQTYISSVFLFSWLFIFQGPSGNSGNYSLIWKIVVFLFTYISFEQMPSQAVWTLQSITFLHSLLSCWLLLSWPFCLVHRWTLWTHPLGKKKNIT